MGQWYEIMHTKNQPFQSDKAKCVMAEYSKLPADEEPGQCFVKFFSPFTRWDSEPNYQIVDTDYDNYSIVYSCDEDDMQYLWILARTPTISEEMSDMLTSKAFAALPNYTTENLIMDDQDVKKCKYS